MPMDSRNEFILAIESNIVWTSDGVGSDS